MKRIVCCMTNGIALDRRMRRVCSSLVDAGYAVELIGVKRNTVPLPSSIDFRASEISCLFKRGKLFYIEYNLRLFFLLLLRKVDVLYLVDVDTFPGGISASIWKRGMSIVYDAHEWFDQLPEVERRPLIRKLWRRITAWGMRHIDFCMTVGQTLAKQLSAEYGKSFHVVRNMPESYQNSAPDPKKQV